MMMALSFVIIFLDEFLLIIHCNNNYTLCPVLRSEGMPPSSCLKKYNSLWNDRTFFFLIIGAHPSSSSNVNWNPQLDAYHAYLFCF